MVNLLHIRPGNALALFFYLFFLPFYHHFFLFLKNICNTQSIYWLISETFCSSSVFFAGDVVVLSRLRPPQGCHPGNVCLRPPLLSAYYLLFKLFFFNICEIIPSFFFSPAFPVSDYVFFFLLPFPPFVSPHV